MLENARRQLLLVVALAVAAIAFLSSLGVRYGLDLQGGTQLIYEMNIAEAKAQGLIPEGASDTEIAEIVDETIAIIADRIDPTGQLDATIVPRGESGILIELPKVGEEEARLIQSRIESLGRLEFRIVAYPGYTEEVDDETIEFDLEEEERRLEEWLADESNRQLVEEDPQNIRVFNSRTDEGGPQSPHLRWFPHLLEPSPDNPERWTESYSNFGQLTVVPAYDDEDWNAGRIPDHYLERPEAERRLIEYVAINMYERHFEGDDLDVSYIRAALSDAGQPVINYRMRPAQETAYADWSEEFTGQASAIILNGEVHSAPTFRDRILGAAQISGDFTQQQVDSLVQVLRTGALQVKPTLQSRDVIGATLGAKSIRLASISIAVGAVLVLTFILAYYRLAGVVAFVGLALNVLLLMGVVSVARTTLTLPGLAGLVLTMGMAVDANILIYERVREELQRGKELLQACRTGFERAIVTIVDANVTTFIAGLVLFNVGVGPIRGFALMLMFGILTTLFTAFFVSRLVFHYLLALDLMRNFRVAHWLDNVHIDFLGKARIAVPLSLLVVIGSIAVFLQTPDDTKYAIDFTGGGNLKIALREPATPQALRQALAQDEAFASEYPEPIVNTVGETENGRAHRFAVRIKLTDEQRHRIERAREAAEDTYEPPYVAQLRTALDQQLVEAPFENAVVDELPESSVSNIASIDLHFDEPVAPDDLHDALRGLGGLELLTDTGEELDGTAVAGYRVQFDVPKDIDADDLFRLVQEPLSRAELTTTTGQPVSLSDPIPESSEIGGRLVGELRNKAITALIISLFAIVMFIRIRFHEFSYGLAAVAALVHDVLITLGFVVLFNALGLVNAEIDLALIAAFLTIIGYSINDTIVIFDRVRENLREHQRLGERIETNSILNNSINQTLSRTLLTTTTTMLVIVTLFVVNLGAGTALEGFSFALLIGLLSGTYSTVFIASPVVNWLWKREVAKGGHHPVDSVRPHVETTTPSV